MSPCAARALALAGILGLSLATDSQAYADSVPIFVRCQSFGGMAMDEGYGGDAETAFPGHGWGEGNDPPGFEIHHNVIYRITENPPTLKRYNSGIDHWDDEAFANYPDSQVSITFDSRINFSATHTIDAGTSNQRYIYDRIEISRTDGSWSKDVRVSDNSLIRTQTGHCEKVPDPSGKPRLF